MRYETVKTAVLTILVIISIVLTWTLWTYQPKYETIKETENIVKETPMKDEKQIPSLIRPSRILFHMDDHHYGTYDETEISRIMKGIRSWEISDLQNISSTVQEQDFSSFLKRNGNVEILYTDKIPLDVYKVIFNINDKAHSLLSFDRLIINVNGDISGEGIVYFVASSDQMIYEAKVSNEEIKSFERNYYYPFGTRYPEQKEYQISSGYSAFLPKDSISMNRLQYYTDQIDVSQFVEGLFSEPNVVKNDVLSSGEEVHTDGTKLLTVNKDKKYIQFVNPMKINDAQGETSELIQTSVDFINEHGGWTGDYRFFSWDKNAQKTLFRLYEGNFPVFDRSGLTEITQTWRKNELVEYEHPMISLRFTPERKETKLPNGDRVIEELTKYPNYQPDKVEDITIAYELVENQQNKSMVSLQPIWCFKYDGKWMKLDINESDNLGGKG